MTLHRIIGALVLACTLLSCARKNHAHCWKLVSIDRRSSWGVLIDYSEIMRMPHHESEYCQRKGQESIRRAILLSEQLDADSLQLPDYRFVSEIQGQLLFGVTSNDLIYMDGKAFVPSAELLNRVWQLPRSRKNDR